MRRGTALGTLYEKLWKTEKPIRELKVHERTLTRDSLSRAATAAIFIIYFPFNLSRSAGYYESGVTRVLASFEKDEHEFQRR